MVAPLGFPNVASDARIVGRQAFSPQPVPTEPTGAKPPTPFVDRLTQTLEQVQSSQKTAESMASGFAEGTNNDVHGTMIAMQKADIHLRFITNVRNRVIEAYRETMRMGA